MYWLIMLCISIPVKSQFMYGTTGLIHSPTADMQRDKTFMLGGSFINHNAAPGTWSLRSYPYHTFNYYINITIFPWLEVGYNMILNKGVPNSSYWPEQTWDKFVNQDRSFHGRLRLWKEGMWMAWTPQIVFGANDPTTHSSYGGGSISVNTDDEDGKNNYLTRWYLAATKHFDFTGIGILGIHGSYIWGRAKGEPKYKHYSAGLNFQFTLQNDTFWWKNAVNGINIMAEICPKPISPTESKQAINIGLGYKIWKDHINLVMEMNECKYLMGGVYFKVHLK